MIERGRVRKREIEGRRERERVRKGGRKIVKGRGERLRMIERGRERR